MIGKPVPAKEMKKGKEYFMRANHDMFPNPSSYKGVFEKNEIYEGEDIAVFSKLINIIKRNGNLAYPEVTKKGPYYYHYADWKFYEVQTATITANSLNRQKSEAMGTYLDKGTKKSIGKYIANEYFGKYSGKKDGGKKRTKHKKRRRGTIKSRRMKMTRSYKFLAKTS